jgi:acyl phosphate:glycerol-3-phosphate acyltransferase
MRQAGRKLYHLLGGVGLLSLYYVLGRERSLIFYGCFFLVVLGIDVLRLRINAVNRFVMRNFSSFIRKNEEHKLTGTAPYILGIGISLFVYAPEIATAAICYLAFGDVAATAIGERYGRTKIRDKSLEGTAAFIIAALTAGFILSFIGIDLMTGVMVMGVLVAAGVEILPLPVNDNLAIPLLSGAAMQLLMNGLK